MDLDDPGGTKINYTCPANRKAGRSCRGDRKARQKDGEMLAFKTGVVQPQAKEHLGLPDSPLALIPKHQVPIVWSFVTGNQ